MLTLLSCYRALCDKVTALLDPWFLPLLARFSFAAVLSVYYWNSGLAKLSDGLFGFLQPTINAYVQIFPTITEAAGYDVDQISWVFTPIALLGSWAEVILPALIIVGLFTRGAALAMVGFVIVQSVVDVYGHNIDAVTRGAWFDGYSDSLVLDQRLLWVTILLVIAVKGAGWLSLDRLFNIDGSAAKD